MLETRGVPVVTYRLGRLPAFWSRVSAMPRPLRLDAPGAIASFFRTREALGIDGGMLVANPVPEADEIAGRDDGNLHRCARIDNAEARKSPARR